MRIYSTISEFREARSGLKGSLGLVPTMGYLHDGHLALVRRARAENDGVAVSIFVNPTQFGPDEDFISYPRDMESDHLILRAEGVDLVFAPSVEEMYPPGFDAWVEVGGVARPLEGQRRPGHFRGVATVVAKLFNVVTPDRAYFGQKDGQQLAVIRRMAADLGLDVDIVAVPTVRGPDGLALSSRNAYLSPEQRKAAAVVYRALSKARTLWQRGERSGQLLRREVRQVLEEEPVLEAVDYVSVADADSLQELCDIRTSAMVSVAVRMGGIRLIDNVLLERIEPT